VTATDANGNTLTGYTGTVHFSNFDPQAVLPADYTFTAADQGVHTFAANLRTAGSYDALFAADTVTPGINGRQVSILVNPGAATHFVLSGPSSITSGTPFDIYATAMDAYGNIATGYNGTVQISSSDGQATLPGNSTFTSGVADLGTFILRTKGTQTITIFDLTDNSILGTWTITVT
jgi:hypothetical protein